MKRHTNPVILVASAWLVFCCNTFAQTRWACVGDSITVGWKLKEVDDYCYKLGLLLGSEYETSNFGHSARTMLRNPVEGWPYWDSPRFTESQDYLPNIVTIMLGTNDTHPNNWPELAAEYEQDAIDLVAVYQSLPSHPRVILMTVPPVKEGNSRNPAILEANSILLNVAAVTACEMADVWSAIENSGLLEREKFKDPIHLDAPAHTVIAELLYAHISSGGSFCGDGFCDANEDGCNCPADCSDEGLEAFCTDGIDDDCDGFTDCADEDCTDDPACKLCENGTCDPGEDQCTCPDDCGSPPVVETNCIDGMDEDCDFSTDCADIDCLEDPDCQGTEVIFRDDFESGDLSKGGWIASGNAQIHEPAAYTGVYGVKLQKVGSIEKRLSTEGRFGIWIEYDRVTMKFEPGDDSLDVEWYDGATWNLIEETADPVWGHASFALPAGADDNAFFRIRFTCNANHPIEKVHLDNVQISD